MPGFDDPSSPDACLFCDIVAGTLPAARIFEDETTLAFMDIAQVTPGHALVIVKRHAPTLFDLTQQEAEAVMRTVHRLAPAIRQAFDAPGLTLLQANGREGFQTVFHFHMHIVPRHQHDGIALNWPRHAPSSQVLLENAERIARLL